MDSYHRPRRRRYAFCLLWTVFAGLVWAQDPPEVPQCNIELGLRSNSGQDPCVVLGELMTPCATNSGQTFNLTSLNTEPLGGLQYPPPESNSSAFGPCQCTEAGYNLYSACAACQVNNDTHWTSHAIWFSQCSLNPIPPAPDEIPLQNLSTWMIHDYEPKFSVAAALSVATGDAPLAASTFEGMTAPGAQASVVTSGTTSSSSSSSSSSLTPIIAGAVVGGVVLLILVALAIFLFRRRRKQRTAPSAEFMKYAPVNATGAAMRDSHRAHSRANTADEEGNMALMHGHASYGGRSSAIRLDSPGGGGAGGLGGDEPGEYEMRESEASPPPFTRGLFKDPIFEKGVALNLAAAANASGPGSGSYANSPIAHSPATPSTLAAQTQYGERHGLIHGRQDTG